MKSKSAFQGSVKVKWSESDIRPSMVTHTRNLCSAFNPSKVRTDSSEHTPMFTFVHIFVPFSIVFCSTVHCRLYTVHKQIVWPWTLCFPFDNSTDCSIDFDWLQVHINKEQKLQSHRGQRTSLWDAGYSTVITGVQAGGRQKKFQRAKQSSNFLINFELLW